MGKYVLGMDGGGTKTHLSVFDIDGNLIDLVTWGKTNHESFRGGYDELKIELNKLFTYVLDRNRIILDDLEICVFGLAGVDTRKQHNIISNILKELGIKDFVLCNDAYLGIKAGCKCGYGICATNGTSSSVGGIDSYGNRIQIGGCGDLSGGEVGGGGYLAGRAFSAVYNSLFKGEPETCITDLLFSLLNINSKFDFVEAINEVLDEGKYRYDYFNKFVFEAANRNDAVALGILDKMGVEYAKCINAVIENLKYDSNHCIEIVLAGSLFVKGENPRAIETLRKFVSEKNLKKDISIRVLENLPVMGAVIWALEEYGIREAFNKVQNNFIMNQI